MMNRIFLTILAALILPAAAATALAGPISPARQASLLDNVPQSQHGKVVLIGHHRWGHRHHRHHHHGRRFGLFFFPGPYYDYGIYRPHRGCYWRCRHWHSPRRRRHRCY